jgi:hypothetical protein
VSAAEQASPAYQQSIRRRLAKIRELAGAPDLRRLELAICRKDVLHWLDWWAWTYDPRNAPGPTHLPFDTWKRQRDLIRFLLARQAANEDGLIEKSRDQGGTYLCAALALHHWLFVPGFKATFGSRKLEYVDRLGNPDTIFEKLRTMLRALPGWMKPATAAARSCSSTRPRSSSTAIAWTLPRRPRRTAASSCRP